MILYYKLRAMVVTWLMRLLPRKAQVVFKGPGSARTLAAEVRVLGHQRVLIVSDDFLASSGILDGIKSVLQAQGVDYRVFDGVLPDPAFDQAEAGARMAREQRSEAVIAVGGGSVLDAAKMISMLVTNPGPLTDFDGIQKSRYPGLPLFAIPTTAGTGSEITGVAVITDPDQQRKVPVLDTKMIPGYVALDAELQQGMPPAITAATGMDALTHAVESFLSTASTASTEQQARAAVRLIFRYLERAWKDGTDMEARDAMAMAAFYAGAAFGMTSVGYVHGIAHQFGRICKTPHGNANAMVLPEVLAAYGEVVEGRLATLAVDVGLGEQSEPGSELSRRFIAAITDMRGRMEMPLKPEGLSPAHVDEVVSAAIKEAGDLYPVMRYLSAEELTTLVSAKVSQTA